MSVPATDKTIINSRKIVSVPLLVVLLCLTQTGCLRLKKSPVSKAEALKAVKVSSVEGWKEVVWDKGRFRVLFPREPRLKGENAAAAMLKGYELIETEASWFVLYKDYDEPRTDDPTELRAAYNKSVEALAKSGATLHRQDDVFLNGRLGTEFVLEGRGAVSYMRAFTIGRRMYMLGVDDKKGFNGSSKLPKDVEQFMNSFTFWE